jgi:hypothetical protein
LRSAVLDSCAGTAIARHRQRHPALLVGMPLERAPSFVMWIASIGALAKSTKADINPSTPPL